MSNKARILIVDDEVENLKALERTLRRSFDVVGTTDPAEALQLALSQDFAVVVSDQKMPGMLGIELLEKIAESKPLVTRIILTAYTETKLVLDAINRAHIHRYLTKPWDNGELVSVVRQAVERYRLRKENEELLERLGERNQALQEKEKELLKLNEHLETLVETRTAELREVNKKLSELAMTDPLTRVVNRRAFFQRFEDEMERSTRYRHPLSVAMIDVDHFKEFNDMEGHVFGDEALKKIANVLTSNLRKTDLLGRYGGEEFILLMPHTKLSVALDICERLRETIELAEFQGKGRTAYLTISIGVAGFPAQGDGSAALVEAADKALYLAKDSGRNRVEGP